MVQILLSISASKNMKGYTVEQVAQKKLQLTADCIWMTTSEQTFW